MTAYDDLIANINTVLATNGLNNITAAQHNQLLKDYVNDIADIVNSSNHPDKSRILTNSTVSGETAEYEAAKKTFSPGVLSGLAVTANGTNPTTQVDIASGSVIFADGTKRDYAGVTGLTPDFLLTATITIFSIDNTGALVQTSAPTQGADLFTRVPIGVVLHNGGLIVGVPSNANKMFANNPSISLRNLSRIIGAINDLTFSGQNRIIGAVAGGLKVDYTGGRFWAADRNASVNQQDPDRPVFAAQANAPFQLAWPTVDSPFVKFISVTELPLNSGNLYHTTGAETQADPFPLGDIGGSQWGNYKWGFNLATNGVVCLVAPAAHGTKDNAREVIVAEEPPAAFQAVTTSVFPCCTSILKGNTTDLNNTSDNEFRNTTKLGDYR